MGRLFQEYAKWDSRTKFERAGMRGYRTTAKQSMTQAENLNVGPKTTISPIRNEALEISNLSSTL